MATMAALAGGGGAGAWLLAARGLAQNPSVQYAAAQAMYAGQHTATAAAASFAEYYPGPIAFACMGAAAATFIGTALLAACACAGGLASFATWAYVPQPPRPNYQASTTTGPHGQEPPPLADIDELADHVIRGGVQTQQSVARRLQVERDAIAAWATAWARATEGPRGFGGGAQRQRHRGR